MSVKVYHNLKESTFYYEYGSLTFVFSSKSHLNKFTNQLDSFILEQAGKFSWKLRCNIFRSQDIFALLLYKIIETRGFLVYLDGNTIPENYQVMMNLWL